MPSLAPEDIEAATARARDAAQKARDHADDPFAWLLFAGVAVALIWIVTKLVRVVLKVASIVAVLSTLAGAVLWVMDRQEHSKFVDDPD